MLTYNLFINSVELILCLFLSEAYEPFMSWRTLGRDCIFFAGAFLFLALFSKNYYLIMNFEAFYLSMPS